MSEVLARIMVEKRMANSQHPGKKLYEMRVWCVQSRTLFGVTAPN